MKIRILVLFTSLVMLLLVLGACAPAAPSVPAAPAQAPTAAPAATQLPTTAPIAMQAPAMSGQTYTILVGGEDTSAGATLDAYFPSTLHIHAGDTVVWKQNVHEIHTVTFLGGAKLPDFLAPVPNGPEGAVMINPQAGFPAGSKDGNYDGTGYVNSGILGMDPGQAPEFKLTFTKTGTYNYVCLVHNMTKMAGSIVVDDASVSVPSQADVDAQARAQMDALKAQIPDVQKAANAETKPDEKNADGTTTHHVTFGYSRGQVDLTAFFPSQLTVAPGDKVVWDMGTMNMAPHTISFFNGAEEPALVMPIPQPNGPPLLTINPAVAVPMNWDKPLTNQGVYNSGLLDPMDPNAHSVTMKIGDAAGTYEYICILHDGNGMQGTITVQK